MASQTEEFRKKFLKYRNAQELANAIRATGLQFSHPQQLAAIIQRMAADASTQGHGGGQIENLLVHIETLDNELILSCSDVTDWDNQVRLDNSIAASVNTPLYTMGVDCEIVCTKQVRNRCLEIVLNNFNLSTPLQDVIAMMDNNQVFVERVQSFAIYIISTDGGFNYIVIKMPGYWSQYAFTPAESAWLEQIVHTIKSMISKV